jgi:two-component system OmpR family sensor kinase
MRTLRHGLIVVRSWRWWPVAATLIIGVIAAAVVGIVGGGLDAYATVSLWSALLVVAVIVAAVIAARLATRAAVERADARALEQARAERHRLLLRLDHELKNPLTAARVGLANLTSLSLSEHAAESAHGVEEQVLRMSQLVANLRKLAELEERPVERDPVAVAELLEEVETDLRDAPAGHGRQLVVTVSRAPWPLPPVRGDRDLLYLALHNLATNALKFSDPADTVEIRAFENRDHVVIEVADTGRGIPTSAQGDVWEELARADNARGVEGSGLGLSLVRSIVAVHGGHASLTSREGAGTLVRLELPAA